MIIDFIIINTTNILLSSILISIFTLNDKKLYYYLILDIIINGIPFITMIIILLYFLNRFIMKYLNNNFINKYILLVIYYFIFNIILYSLFNTFSIYIINTLISNLIYNLIIFFIGLKYNLREESYE